MAPEPVLDIWKKDLHFSGEWFAEMFFHRVLSMAPLYATLYEADHKLGKEKTKRSENEEEGAKRAATTTSS